MNQSLLVVVLCAGTANANPDKEQKVLAERTADMNKTCGTTITATGDHAAWSKFPDIAQNGGAWAHFCGPIFTAISSACTKEQSIDPHPAGQQWIKSNIKSIHCAPGPVTGKRSVKITLTAGKIAFLPEPGHSVGSETERLWSSSKDAASSNEALKALGGLHLARRLWDAEQRIRAAEKAANDACGSKIAVSMDLPSWQAVGVLTGTYPDITAEDHAVEHVGAVAKACKENKDVAKHVKQLIVRYAGEKKPSGPPQLANGTLTITQGWDRSDKDVEKTFELAKRIKGASAK